MKNIYPSLIQSERIEQNTIMINLKCNLSRMKIYISPVEFESIEYNIWFFGFFFESNMLQSEKIK